MTIEEIIEELGEPEIALNKAENIYANENSYYLYELHQMYNFWENKVWFFNDLQEFYDYAYSHVMIQYVNRELDEEYDFDDDTDRSELYRYLLKLKKTIWTIEECENFIKSFSDSSFELVEFGKVIDLIAITDEDFEKCKEHYSTKEELENINLKEGCYKIISGYINKNYKKTKKPKESLAEFLAYLNHQ
jgi:hypothetical protein